ncbi:hypothetical protein GQ42DRAFT_159840 [Ramicandelaber brevisporus]|nr:hypothetical protein GQ42DRAFT_159840 [Ramicandelaber brevisporus]
MTNSKANAEEERALLYLFLGLLSLLLLSILWCLLYGTRLGQVLLRQIGLGRFSAGDTYSRSRHERLHYTRRGHSAFSTGDYDDDGEDDDDIEMDNLDTKRRSGASSGMYAQSSGSKGMSARYSGRGPFHGGYDNQHLQR